MTNKKKVFLGLIIAALMAASFFCGSYLKEKENERIRMERCNVLITLALDKVNHGDLTDEPTMKVFISDIYAAYKSCDDDYIASELCDIWNALLFDSNAFAGQEDVLAARLSGAYQGM